MLSRNTLLVDAGSFPTDDGWIGRLASSVPKVLSENFKSTSLQLRMS